MMENCEKDLKYTKKIYRMHIAYIVIICGILMIGTLCVMPMYITDEAFQNVSFSSALVSIVLAVVSIVYSLWSGQKSNNQYVGISNIERKIDSQLESFAQIERALAEKLAPINSQLTQMHEDQPKTYSQLEELKSKLGESRSLGSSLSEDTKVGGSLYYDLENSPLYANMSLYVMALSYLKQKAIPSDIVDKSTKNYWAGYLVALSRVMPEKVGYELTKPSVKVTTFDTSFFGTAEDIKKILQTKDDDQMKAFFNEIDQYFGIGNIDANQRTEGVSGSESAN